MHQSLLPLVKDRRGVAVIEFALVLPLLALLLLGVSAYGQYFLLAHSVQQMANDAARATIAGLSQSERVTLANATVANETARLPNVTIDQVAVSVAQPQDDLLTVRIRLNATGNPLFGLKLVPMPDAVIERGATVRVGGLE